MAVNSRSKGAKFELWCIDKMRHLFPDAVSSRSESKRLDDAGVDICYTGNFSFQCKAVEKGLNPRRVIEAMPDDGKVNILLWKRNRKGVLAITDKPISMAFVLPSTLEMPATKLHDNVTSPTLWKYQSKTFYVYPFEDFLGVMPKSAVLY